MANAGYKTKLQVSVDGSTNWKDVPATSPSLDLGSEVLDITTIGGDGYRKQILGLHNWSVNADSNWDANDDGLKLIRAAMIGRSALYVRFLSDGTTASGYKGAVVVESFNMSSDVGSQTTVSISLQGSGSLSSA